MNGLWKTGTERANFCAVCEMGKNAFHGEFGISFKYKQDVLEVIGGRIGNTLLLGGIGFVIMFAGALLLGILCAWYETGWQIGFYVNWVRYPAVSRNSGWRWC